MKLSKLLLATLGAAMLLGACVGSSSARSFSTSSQTWRVAFRSVTFRGAFGNMRCPVTFEGSFHARTIAKVSGALVGDITAAALGACETGSATLLTASLPWHARYASFTGTLPNITSTRVNVIGYGFQRREPAFTCLARSTEASPLVITYNREAGGALTTASLSGSIPSSCGINEALETTVDPITVPNSSTRITITLI